MHSRERLNSLAYLCPPLRSPPPPPPVRAFSNQSLRDRIDLFQGQVTASTRRQDIGMDGGEREQERCSSAPEDYERTFILERSKTDCNARA